MSRPLWHGRMAEAPSDALWAFSESFSFDRRLALDDLRGSRAHVRGLEAAGLLSAQESCALLCTLDRVEDEFRAGTFVGEAGDEDVHSAIERRVTELAGPVGGKLHTGRSRNDQVATALRLFVRRELPATAERVLSLQSVLVERAAEVGAAYLPGYTHLQRAQPVPLAHHLMAHAWALARDFDRLLDACGRADGSPLGAGALAGSSLPLDPDRVATELGFGTRFENSLDAVGDRDFVADALYALAMVGVHLSRIGEEVVLWTSAEFGYLTLADADATGSSMLPQKKNADIAELARGKAGRLVGNLTALLVVMKGLPLAYNRDLQEDKEPLFDSLDTVNRALDALTGLWRRAAFDQAAMEGAAADPAAQAVELANRLVRAGMPFREAHARVGTLVRRSLEEAVPLDRLVATEPGLGHEAGMLLHPARALDVNRTPGGAGYAAVSEQRSRLERRLSDAWSRLARL